MIKREPHDAYAITAAIDHELAGGMRLLLEKHGATVVQLDVFTYKAMSPRGEQTMRVASNHRISFPQGTQRQDGVMLATSCDFTIVFPDGFELKGLFQMGMIGGDKTILFLPN